MAALNDLLNTYSLSDIFIVVAAVGGISISVWKGLDWVLKRLKRIFAKEHIEKKKEDALEVRLIALEARLTKAEQSGSKVAESMDFFSDKLAILVDSDKDSIKAYLTDKHHYYVFTQKWIDDYNLDCIERRYVHYKKAGGNSFVDHLMDELRLLPTRPPEKGE